MKHLLHVLAVVIASMAGTLALGIGAAFTGALLAGVAYSAIASIVIVALGVGSLIVARTIFGLAQMGMLLQMILFFLLTWLALAIAPVSIITLSQGWLASASILAMVMVLAKLTGGFSSSFKRQWLPVRRKQIKK